MKILSEDLQFWRAERPDEWIMDRFIQKAIILEREVEYLNKRLLNRIEEVSRLACKLDFIVATATEALNGEE